MCYNDVANRLVASPALSIDKKTAFDAVSMAVVVLRTYQRARCLCQVLCLLIVNVGAATGRLVTSLYRTVPPWKAVITAGLRLLTYTFSEIKVYFSFRGFLDIEKSVLLELKGVKVIRSYRDFFQLIRDFLRINDTFRLFIWFHCYLQELLIWSL